MKIVLIGFMGSGKSSIAKKLAERLDLEFIEMDELCIKKSRRNSISEIFEKDGEIIFREIEIYTAKDLINRENVIISAGGGVVMNKINLDYLKKNGIVIFLDTAFEIIEKRLMDDNTRPLFKDKKKAKQLYDFRLPLYKYYADVIINTDNKSVEEIAKEIVSRIKK